MRRRLAVALIAAAAVAGCGGSHTTTTTAAATPAPTATATPAQGLTRVALATRAGAICDRYSALAKQLGTPDISQPAAAVRYFRAATKLARRQQAEFEALHPPAAVATQYRAFLNASSDAIGLLDQLAQAAQAADKRRGAKLIQRLAPISQRVDSASHAIGADACATN